MAEQTQKIIETFQSMLRRDLSLLAFWQEFDAENEQDTPRSIDDLIAEIPETLSSDEDFEKLKEIALSTMEFCQKKKVLLEKLSAELTELNGI